MKKYGLVILLFFLFIIVNFGKSYSYRECDNYVFYSNDLNSLDLDVFLSDASYSEVKEICSGDFCYKVKSGDISKIVDSFNDLYFKNMPSDTILELKMKGVPITKITFDICS